MDGRYAVVVAGGHLHVWPEDLVKGASLVVAADKGASFLHSHLVVPDVVIGDFDSCDNHVVETLRAEGSRVVQLEREKDETDTEAALDLVRLQGYTKVVLLGALGGPRIEHCLANVFLLERYAKCGMDVSVRSGVTRITWACGDDYPSKKARSVRGSPGDFLSLIPVTERVLGVVTRGLKYPLDDGCLLRGLTLGISNELVGTEAQVSCEKGFLLVVFTKGVGYLPAPGN